ncbi:MAG: PASTA domain-containing protein [Actinomycetota bacterium]|nr:PASTA domain-containing protein [Actinomycetota bacterium]
MVPDLAGLLFHEAMDACYGEGLRLRHTSDPDAAEGEGVVTGQDPSPGTTVPIRTVVTVSLRFDSMPEGGWAGPPHRLR